MRIISIWLLVISLLICNCSFAQSKSANQKTVTTKNTTASNKITCTFCNGTGSGEGVPLACMNCYNWSADYRKKNLCHVCKNTRVVYEKKCPICGGTGKLDRDWYKFGLSDKSLDSAFRLSAEYKKKVPITDKPMTDDQAWKMFNEYANPDLKQNGYGEIRQTVMDDYPMRPKEDRTQYADVFNEEDMKFRVPTDEEDDSLRYEAFIQREIQKGVRSEAEIRKILADQRAKNGKQETGEQNRKRLQLDQKINILKTFFGNGFTYNQFGDRDLTVSIVGPSINSFIVRDFEIDGDILVNKADPNAVYNRKGKLLYQGNWSIKTFSYKEADLNKSYVCIYQRDDFTDSYKAIVGTSDDQVIIKMTEEVPSGASYKKSELFAVFGNRGLVDGFSKGNVEMVDLFSTNNTDKFRYIVLKVCSSNVTSLGNINYEYKIFDLKTGKQIKSVNESNVKSYLAKVLKN